MDQNKTKWAIIKCPHCGYNYVPAEIKMPGDFLGKPESVVRDALGKILFHEYPEDNEPGMLESYICDNCEKSFIVEPIITYKVRKEAEELDFSDPYVSLLND